ncbi:cobalt ECF transporter T component CbiQ [bacterium]|nr:cobalt ECF transporter T component CbiQ [bacterium]
MHLPEIDKYAHLSSVFHRFDPRVKIISIGILIFSVALLQDIRAASLGLLLSCLLVLLSKIPFSFIFIHLRWVLLFVIFFFLIMPLTYRPIEGLKLALLIGLRAVACVLLIFPMIGTNRFDVTLKAIAGLGMPNKLLQLIMFSYRYIFVLFDELRRMLIAARVRGFKKQLSLKIAAHIIGMLIIRAYERTNRIYYAMLSRGYTGRIETPGEFSLELMDIAAGSLIIAWGILLLSIGG